MVKNVLLNKKMNQIHDTDIHQKVSESVYFRQYFQFLWWVH